MITSLTGLAQTFLEAISKMSFGSISLLGPRFKSSKYSSIPPVLTHNGRKSDGESRVAGKTLLRRELEPKSYF
jgi:hypothetical protein